MELKPKFDNTIKMNVSSVKLSAPSGVKKETDSVIPNGIYGVIRWERIRQWFTLGLNASIVMAAIILASLYATIIDVSWIAYIVPIIMFLLSGWKLMTTWFERQRLKRDVERYKEDLRVNLDSTPPLISNLYKRLHISQVGHNWITITLLFYGGIATLLLWWLKDVSWWIFDFESWISNMFSSPTTMAWLFTALLTFVAVSHILFAIQRQKRIREIDSYFGMKLGNPTDIENFKAARSKAYRRMFIISIMIILIIPLVVKFALKVIRKK